jgi:hypothetical protein
MSSDKNAVVPKFTLAILAQLTVNERWQVLMTIGSDPVFSFALKNQRRTRTVDSFEVRAQFLEISSPEEAAEFFREFGPFQLRAGVSGAKSTSIAARVKWSLIQRAQREFEAALTKREVTPDLFEFVFEQPLRIELNFRAAQPDRPRGRTTRSYNDAALAPSADVIDALRTTTVLNRMRGFTWKRCARQRCNLLFEVENLKARLYCSPGCAHNQAANRYNARRKKAKPQNMGGKDAKG